MERLRRRPAIDITWLSCRGVRSSLPFHTPCLYASIFAVWSSAHGQHRRHHRVKTPTDRAGGENPEWDAPLRLYLPDAAEATAAAGGKNSDTEDDVLLVKFEVKASAAVLGDVHAASAAVPVPDLVADGQTRRVSYQLVGPDGRQPNGVVSFSYAFFHERNVVDDDGSQSSSSEPASPSCPTAISAPPPTIVAAAPRLYPDLEWALTEQPTTAVYPPVTAKNDFTVADTHYYHPTPPAPVDPISVYPPPPPAEAASVYPPVRVTDNSFSSVAMYPTLEEPAKATALYPSLDLVAPVSYYPPPTQWGDRCLFG